MPTFEAPTEAMEASFEKAFSLDAHRDRLATVNFAFDQALASRDTKTDEPRGNAIKDGDLTCVKINNLQRRSNGAADVQFTFNGDKWGSTSAQSQVSACDEALTYLEAILDDDGDPINDAKGRPKLKMRKPDVSVKGFTEVAERHGKHSQVVQKLRTLCHSNGQIYLPWLLEAPPESMLTASRPPQAPRKALGGGKYKRGKLRVKPLRIRLDQVKRPETWLAVLDLELGMTKPRSGIVEALKDRATQDLQVPAYLAIEKGDDPGLKLDKAAAVLLTTIGLPDVARLDVLVQECEDASVLEGLVEEERLGGAREDVVNVISQRIAELSDLPSPVEAAANDNSAVVH